MRSRPVNSTVNRPIGFMQKLVLIVGGHSNSLQDLLNALRRRREVDVNRT